MILPENLRYTREHEWINQDGKTGTIGITDFAQKELGDIVFVEIETLGQEVPQNKIFGTIEAVKTVSDLFLPLSGKIIEFNPKISNNPELINKDPYGEGWIIKIEISNDQESENLLTAQNYRALIENA